MMIADQICHVVTVESARLVAVVLMSCVAAVVCFLSNFGSTRNQNVPETGVTIDLYFGCLLKNIAAVGLDLPAFYECAFLFSTAFRSKLCETRKSLLSLKLLTSMYTHIHNNSNCYNRRGLKKSLVLLSKKT